MSTGLAVSRHSEERAEGAAGCCHHLVCRHQHGDIMPRVDSWGQWQGLTALPTAAAVPGKCVCVPQALPGDLNSTGH